MAKVRDKNGIVIRTREKAGMKYVVFARTAGKWGLREDSDLSRIPTDDAKIAERAFGLPKIRVGVVIPESEVSFADLAERITIMPETIRKFSSKAEVLAALGGEFEWCKVTWVAFDREKVYMSIAGRDAITLEGDDVRYWILKVDLDLADVKQAELEFSVDDPVKREMVKYIRREEPEDSAWTDVNHGTRVEHWRDGERVRTEKFFQIDGKERVAGVKLTSEE